MWGSVAVEEKANTGKKDEPARRTEDTRVSKRYHVLFQERSGIIVDQSIAVHTLPMCMLT